MARIRVLAFVVCLLTSMANSQDAKDPIDQNLDACLNSPGAASTAGQTDCAAKAYIAWDAELNQVYQKLIKTLDPASRDLLRASQRRWLAFRESEKQFQGGPWRKKGGTLIGVSLNLDNVQALRSRVMALRTYAAVAK